MVYARFGTYNTALGVRALQNNWYGQYYNATGAFSLWTNYNRHHNTANGFYALYSNSNGTNNIAIGNYSLYTNSTGTDNMANGYRALYSNTTGNYNTSLAVIRCTQILPEAIIPPTGYYALADNTTGLEITQQVSVRLTTIPLEAITPRREHLLSTTSALVTTTAHSVICRSHRIDLSNTTALGYLAVPTASNQVRIGNTSVTSIGGQVEWTAFSDGRFKKDIKEDVSGLDFINELRPVSYTVDKAGLNKFLHVTEAVQIKRKRKVFPCGKPVLLHRRLRRS